MEFPSSRVYYSGFYWRLINEDIEITPVSIKCETVHGASSRELEWPDRASSTAVLIVHRWKMSLSGSLDRVKPYVYRI